MKSFSFLKKTQIVRGSFITIIVTFLFMFLPITNVYAANIFEKTYGEDYIREHVATYTNYITGIALAVLVFSVPYLIYLWGSGTPENLKKAHQYIISLIGGLMVVLLGYSILTNIIGKGLFGSGL